MFEIDSKKQNSQDKALTFVAPLPNTLKRSGVKREFPWLEREGNILILFILQNKDGK